MSSAQGDFGGVELPSSSMQKPKGRPSFVPPLRQLPLRCANDHDAVCAVSERGHHSNSSQSLWSIALATDRGRTPAATARGVRGSSWAAQRSDSTPRDGVRPGTASVLGSHIEALQRQSDADHRRLGQLERRLEACLAERQPSEKFAQLQGSFQGLSEELQSLQRRVEAVDERLWQRTNGNELGKVRADLEQQLQSLELQCQQRGNEVAAVQMAQKRHGAKAQRAEQLSDELSTRLAGIEQQLQSMAELQLEARMLSVEERIVMDVHEIESRFSDLSIMLQHRAEPQGIDTDNSAFVDQALASLEARLGSQLAVVASEAAFLRVKVSGQGERLEAMFERLDTSVHAPVEALRKEVQAIRNSGPGKAVQELCQALESLRVDVACLSGAELPGAALGERVSALEAFWDEADASKRDDKGSQERIAGLESQTNVEASALQRSPEDPAEKLQQSPNMAELLGRLNSTGKEIAGHGESVGELQATHEVSVLESESDISAIGGSECTSTNCSGNLPRFGSTRSLTRTKSDLHKLR